MVVAWKPRTQARKTILQAAPWLRAAKRVTVVTIDETHPDQVGADVLTLLKDQGVAADVHHARSAAGQHIAERLLSEADALSADAIVMGAFRFGQIFEWVFGGVTHEVLRRTHLPVFMMH
ncbi:MAG TPA: universal stress protein [Rhodoblastus sp.]|nr:universal stress protein [Rhodoblastus sp.]